MIAYFKNCPDFAFLDYIMPQKHFSIYLNNKFRMKNKLQKLQFLLEKHKDSLQWAERVRNWYNLTSIFQ